MKLSPSCRRALRQTSAWVLCLKSDVISGARDGFATLYMTLFWPSAIETNTINGEKNAVNLMMSTAEKMNFPKNVEEEESKRFIMIPQQSNATLSCAERRHSTISVRNKTENHPIEASAGSACCAAADVYRTSAYTTLAK